MTSPSIPLTVIGGYLGAGKTTLINGLLRHNEGRRLAVIVNDFGEINIDAELIEGQDGDTINLANGCICCTLGADLAVTLMKLMENDPPPDHILIEASGVADPAQVAQYGYISGLRLDGIIVLADAETVRKKARDKYVGEQVVRQLRAADLLLLNKTDLVSKEALHTIRDWLQRLVPNARIIATVHAKVPSAFLLGTNHHTSTPHLHSIQQSASMITSGHNHHPQYETWSYVFDNPIDQAAFQAMIDALPENVIRAKGVVYLKEHPDRKFIFQMVGKRWSLEPDKPWAQARPQTRLVMIGTPGKANGFSPRLAK